MSAAAGIQRELSQVLGQGAVLPGDSAAYLSDATESRSLRGRADAIALPSSPEQVAQVVRWCYARDVALVARGGGTGFAGGAVPLDGGVVLALERLRGAHLDPELWRARAQAGVTTADLRRRARENGLLFPPDPGAAEQSQIGGNIATNAGGPHAFKYGATGAWITGLEAVVAPGELIAVGGPVRKDVAGYDLKSLLIGSEGTLGIVTAAWLKLVPAPQAAFPVAAVYADAKAGCAAVQRVLGSGLGVAALEFLDDGALQATRANFPGDLKVNFRFMLLADADGSAEEAQRLRSELIEVLGEQALGIHAPQDRREVAAVWRWRDGTSGAVTSQLGGKASEDIVVPLERLLEAIEGTLAIGRRHGLRACSWGHAGDGNLHSTFMVHPDDASDLRRADAAAEDLFALAISLGGSISGEHGVGWIKRGQLGRQWAPAALELHESVKRAFDPKGLLNPQKKLARVLAARAE